MVEKRLEDFFFILVGIGEGVIELFGVVFEAFLVGFEAHDFGFEVALGGDI